MMHRIPANQGRTAALLRRIRGVVVITHAVPVLCVLVATAIFALVADSSPHLPTLLRLLGMMAGIQMAIGALNDYLDLPLDRQTKPWKPLVCGDLRPATALWLTAGGLIAALVIGIPLGALSLAFGGLGAAAGLSYNLYFKDSSWSWVPYAVAIPLLPIWVWSTVRGWDGRLLSVYPLGGCMVVSLYLADTLPDIRADSAYGIRGFAHRLGERRALRLCWLGALAPPLLASGIAALGIVARAQVVPAALLALLQIGLAIAYYTCASRPDWRLHFALLAGAAMTLGGGWLRAF